MALMRGLSTIIGQESLKSRVIRQIVSCQERNAVFEHTLLTGIGGCGKTAIARAIAEELQYHFVETEAAAFRTRDIMIDRLIQSSQQAGSQTLLFFIDEAHRLSLLLQEALYYPMVEHRITTADGDRSFPVFTLVAATTHMDLLSQGSLMTRFTNVFDVGRYEIEDIETIVKGALVKDGIEIGLKELRAVAQRALGIPRIAINLSKKVRDQVIFRRGDRTVTANDVNDTFALEGIDDLGLTELHRQYLMELERSNGKPKGINTIARSMGQSKDVLEETIEPILLSFRLVDATPRGKVLTSAGRAHLLSLRQYAG